jgi:hypothetical protein
LCPGDLGHDQAFGAGLDCPDDWPQRG